MRKGFFFFLLLISGSVFSQQSKEMFERSLEAFSRGELKTADSLISKSIEYDGKEHKDFLKYYNRGIFRMEMDSIQKAVFDFVQSIDLNNKFYPAYENLSICKFYLGETQEALKYIEQGILVDKTEPEAYALASMYSLETGNLEKCIKFSSEGLVLKKDPRLYFNRSIAYFKKSKTDYAEKDLISCESVFGNNNDYCLRLRVYYSYKSKTKDFCNLLNSYRSKVNKLFKTYDFYDNEFKSAVEKKCS